MCASATAVTVLLASGRTADVYALDERRVLRRYRTGRDVTAEAATMTYPAGHGFPVPEVYEATRADLVMARVHGPTLTPQEITRVPAAAVLARHLLTCGAGGCRGGRPADQGRDGGGLP